MYIDQEDFSSPYSFSMQPLGAPSIAQSPLFARLFDKFTPHADVSLDDDEKKRMFRQGLLQLAANISKPNGGNFANSLATGLLAGTQGMNQSVDDLSKRRYQSALLADKAAGPTEFRAADALAQAAGFKPGTPEYQHYMRVHGGVDARQSSAAIQYKQQLGADGVMRYIALDPNQVGAQAIGSGDTFGGPVGRPQLPYQQPQNAPQQPMPQQAAPQQAPNVEAVLAQANQMAQSGQPGDQVDAWVQAQLNPPQGQMPPRPMSQPSPSPAFQSRPQEQQKQLDALGAGRGSNQAAIEQMPYEAAQAGNIERTKVLANAGANLATAGAQATTAGSIEAGKTQGEAAAKTYMQIQDAAKMARSENNNLKMLRANLQNTYTGPGANAVLGAKRAANALGIKVEGMGEAEAARALSNRMALALRNPAGGEGMPGSMSNQDRTFLQQSIPSLTSTPAGWKAMVNMRLALNQNAIDQAQYAERLRMSGVPVQNIPGMLQKWADEHPIFHPKKAAAPAASGWGIERVGN